MNNENKEKLVFGLLIVLGLLVIYNQFQLTSINSLSLGVSGAATSTSILPSVSASDVIPKGVPKIYGKELGVSYDDVSANNPQLAERTIAKLAQYDDGISLTGADLDRYILIASKISCEYCCGAESIIFSNGQAACGCAHSYAMRGIAKYIITKHPNEFTDDEILEELGKWKTLFFPGIMQQKANVLQQNGIKFNYINLASNKYRGIEKGASGGSMVGGC